MLKETKIISISQKQQRRKQTSVCISWIQNNFIGAHAWFHHNERTTFPAGSHHIKPRLRLEIRSRLMSIRTQFIARLNFIRNPPFFTVIKGQRLMRQHTGRRREDEAIKQPTAATLIAATRCISCNFIIQLDCFLRFGLSLVAATLWSDVAMSGGPFSQFICAHMHNDSAAAAHTLLCVCVCMYNVALSNSSSHTVLYNARGSVWLK
jgi:hypothetical protein